MSEPRATCPTCDRPFGQRKRCYYCQPARKRSGIESACTQCGTIFPVPQWKIDRGEGKTCSYECRAAAMRGVETRKGSRYRRPDGYIAVKTGIRTYALEHRLVMAEAIGRPLLDSEQVNHINHVRDDNRRANLEILTATEHSRETAAYAKVKRREAREELKALRLRVAEYERRYGPLT